MTRKEAINRLTNTLQEMRAFFFDSKHISEDYEKDLESMEMAIKALEQEDILDKIDKIITDALDKSTDQKESQTLRWVLDKISEVT